MTTTVREVMRRPAVEKAVGLGDTQLDALVAAREFPASFPISDGGRARGWWAHEIAAWQEARDVARAAELAEKPRERAR